MCKKKKADKQALFISTMNEIRVQASTPNVVADKRGNRQPQPIKLGDGGPGDVVVALMLERMNLGISCSHLPIWTDENSLVAGLASCMLGTAYNTYIRSS
jgi:hypothetical protein